MKKPLWIEFLQRLFVLNSLTWTLNYFMPEVRLQDLFSKQLINIDIFERN